MILEYRAKAKELNERNKDAEYFYCELRAWYTKQRAVHQEVKTCDNDFSIGHGSMK